MTSTPDKIDRIGELAVRRIHSGRPHSALRILQENGLDDAANELNHQNKSVTKHEFSCPAHHAPVVSDCRLQECKFWVKHEMANNCLLAYCQQQQVERLSTDEIAYLYAQPIEVVSREIDAAMSKLRITAIQQDSQNDFEIKRSFWFVETAEVCCVCGSTTDKDKVLVVGTPLAYCSRDCSDELTPDSITVEWRFGRPIDKVLKWAVRRFKNLPLMEKTLGLKRETLIELTSKFLGRELQDYFPKFKMRSEKPGWRRRTTSAEIEQLLDVTAKHTDKTARRFGRPSIQIDELRTNLTDLLK